MKHSPISKVVTGIGGIRASNNIDTESVKILIPTFKNTYHQKKSTQHSCNGSHFTPAGSLKTEFELDTLTLTQAAAAAPPASRRRNANLDRGLQCQ